jgi:hypothetical protein
MGRFVARSCLVSISLVVGCGPPEIEVEPICVSTRVLELNPCWVTRSGALLLQTPEGLVVRQLHEDGTLSELATLEVDGTCEWGTPFEHDPATGRMWLIVPGAFNEPPPGRLLQFDSTGHVEWERELVHEGRNSRYGWVYHHDGALFVSLSLEPLVPFDPQDPDDWPESPTLLVEQLDLAGELVWARMDYYLEPDAGEPYFYASGAVLGMTSGGLAMRATPPLFDSGPSFPLVISPDDGAVLWTGEGHEHLGVATDGENLFASWTLGSRLDFENQGNGTPRTELEPARSLLDIRSPTGELLGHGEAEWPGWGDLSSSSALLGDQIATIVGPSSGGPSGIALHAKDGTLECKGMLELGDAKLGYATSIEGREQVVAYIARGVGEEGEYGYAEYEPALLLLGLPAEP